MSWRQKTSKKMQMHRMLKKRTLRRTIPTSKATLIRKGVARSGRQNGSGLADRVLSALLISAGAIADAAQVSWTNAVRHSRVDLAEICCTADSQLAGEVISKGGTADRYSHWNGYDLTTRKGTDALRSKLESTRP